MFYFAVFGLLVVILVLLTDIHSYYLQKKKRQARFLSACKPKLLVAEFPKPPMIEVPMPTNKPTPLLRRFEFKQGRSNKFWEAWTEDKIAVTHWGRIGTAGAYQRKDFRTPFTAEEHIRNAIREKLAKGYVEVSVSPTLVAADKWTPVQPPVSSTVKQEEVPDIILERIEPERKQKRAFKL